MAAMDLKKSNGNLLFALKVKLSTQASDLTVGGSFGKYPCRILVLALIVVWMIVLFTEMENV